MIAEEVEAAGLVGDEQHGEEQPAEQAREHADGQEEAGPARYPTLAVARDAAAPHDHVDVRGMGHGRAPAVQHRGDADARAEMPPPGTIMWTCGGWVMAGPQLCSTEVMPTRAPRCLGSAAIVVRVSAETLNRRS